MAPRWCVAGATMSMRHGMPPIQQALDSGIRPSLSSDVETTMAADMFTQMRTIFALQRALLNERSIIRNPSQQRTFVGGANSINPAQAPSPSLGF